MESNLPIPVYRTALLIPLLTIKTKKIIITNIVIPRPKSKTYSLSIIFFKCGLTLEKIMSVMIYANNHFVLDKILKTHPFLYHLIKDKIVIIKYIISIIDVASDDWLVELDTILDWL